MKQGVATKRRKTRLRQNLKKRKIEEAADFRQSCNNIKIVREEEKVESEVESLTLNQKLLDNYIVDKKCDYCGSTKNINIYIKGKEFKLTSHLMFKKYTTRCFDYSEVRCIDCHFLEKWDEFYDEEHHSYEDGDIEDFSSMKVKKNDLIYFNRTGNKKLDKELDAEGMLDIGGRFKHFNSVSKKLKTRNSDPDGGRKMLRDARDNRMTENVILYTKGKY